MTKLKRTGIGLGAIMLSAGFIACAQGTPTTGTVDSSLRRAQNCDELLDMLRTDAVAKVNAQADRAIKDGPDWGYLEGDGLAMPAGGGGGTTGAPTNDGARGPSGHSETNNQVEGVDEADIVKTDGEHLWLLHGSELEVLRTWPPQSTAVTQSLAIEGSPSELFVHEGQAVVFSHVWEDDCAGGIDGRSGAPVADDWGGEGCYLASESFTKLTVVDLESDTPRVVRELYVEGNYESSRRHGMTVRAVVDGGYALPQAAYPDYWGDYEGSFSAAVPGFDLGWKKSVNDWRERAIRAINQHELNDWLPTMRERKDGALVDIAPSCGDFYVPDDASTGDGITSVVGIDLADPSRLLPGASIVGYAEHVYANHETLIVAHQEYSESWPQVGSQTALHQFQIGEHSIAYDASGTVPGHIHDQFSIDEKDGTVRVSTTEWNWNRADDESVNRVLTLQERDGELEVVGDTGPLAPGETIFSTRFVGNKGYVVTFRQVDPLFVVDLADPTSPTVLAELKIPGFSDYMHPLGDSHLLTIGRDVAEDGFSNDALALQIFDVSEPTAPRLAHKHVFGREGWSEANHDHKAFTFYADKGLLAFPFSGWSDFGGGYSSTLEVFDVDAEAGFSHLGSVDHTRFVSDQMCQDEWGYYSCGYNPDVRRGVFIDDFVYSISYGGVLVHSMQDLNSEVAAVDLPSPNFQ